MQHLGSLRFHALTLSGREYADIHGYSLVYFLEWAKGNHKGQGTSSQIVFGELERKSAIRNSSVCYHDGCNMDPVTHGLAGALISRAGFTQKLGKRAGWILPGTAMFPDLDILYRLEGLPTYIQNHRALSHSFVGILLSGILIGAVLGRLDEERRYTAWMSACWVGLFSHQVLDLVTSYGTVVLYPFSTRRFYLDWVFVIDVFLSATLLVAWWMARRAKQDAGKRIAFHGIVVSIGYIIFCALNHSLALHQLKVAGRISQIQYRSLAAIPQPLLPFRWSGILDTGTHYYQIPMFSFRMPEAPFQVYNKTTGSLFEQKARESELGQLYTWFARYPVITEKAENSYHIVEFSDLRFYIRVHTFPVRKPFVLRIKLDADGNVLESRFARM